MSTLTLANLVSAMNGSTTTNQWDVVCSYSVDALNSFLKASYDAGNLAKTVIMTVTEKDPVFGFDYQVLYSINFGSPLLSFSALQGIAILSMPMETGSSYTVTVPNSNQPPQVTPIPPGYSVVAQVPLAVVDGETGTVVANQPGVLTFSNGSTSQFSVILEFNNKAGTLFTLSPAPSGSSPLETYFLPAITNYFQTQVSQIDYALAAVNNTPSGGGVVFSPKSFVFTSYYDPTIQSDNGALSLYIQTTNSGNPPGSSTPQFQPGGMATSPIPSGYTASLIFSNALMMNAYLKPQLAADNFTATFSTPKSGLQAALTTNADVVANSDNGTYISGSYYYQGLDLSLETYPITMTILNGQMGCNWSGDTVSGWTTNTAGQPYPQWGNVKISVTAEKVVTMAVNDNAITIPSITFSQSDFKATTTPQSCPWYETLTGCRTSLPAYYSGMQFSIPPISISLPSFNFFLETNLLAPGNQMISIDAAAGVSTPCDFLLVGNTITVPTAGA